MSELSKEIVTNVVVPYYGNPDKLAHNNYQVIDEVIDKYIDLHVLTNLLKDHGWRNRVVAATIIGALRIERFILQIRTQFLEKPEFHQAQSYAFALARIKNQDALDSLRAMVGLRTRDPLIPVIKPYMEASIDIISNGYFSKSGKEIEYIRERLLIWELYKPREDIRARFETNFG